MGGFSFASVVLSYFLVAGGLLCGQLAITYAHTSSDPVRFALWAAGSFVGGFFAARASRGSTIIEPAIAAVGVIATVVLMIAGSDTGKLMWGAEGMTSVGKFVAEMAGSVAVGALVGAFLSEKILGESTLSAIPWILYSALTTFGATFAGTFIAAVLFVKKHIADGDGLNVESYKQYEDALASMIVVGIGIGCLLAGLAIGASARVRVLAASAFGGAVGVAGFLVLSTVASHNTRDKDVIIGIVAFAVGGGIVTVIGSALGWAMIGKRAA
jgi:hypothetical protein